MIKVLPGDVVSCESTGNWLSRLIRWKTHSRYSHSQLVLWGGTVEKGDFLVMEVGWRIRTAEFRSLNRGGFRIDRPKAPEGVDDYGWRVEVARDAKWLLAKLVDWGKDRYPWWKLGGYLLPRRLRGKVLLGGPRQVCSVMTVRPLVSHGWKLLVRDGNKSPFLRDWKRIDDPDEIQTVEPADLVRWFEAAGGDPVYVTP